MTAPFAPELTSPKNKGASAAASVTLKWKFRSVAAGDYMATYAIRRRQMTPTVGAYEYWTGAAWGAETFLAPGVPTDYKDGVEFSTTITTGWTTDRVYQWSVKARNAAAEASAYADDSLIQIHAAPTMTVAVSSTAVSRPKISWVWAGAAGYYQRSYQIAVYSAAVQSAVGFDASSAVWQALATWISAKKYGAADYRIQVDADLASGTQYYVYYKTEDNSDLSSGWVNATNFTPTYTAVPAPTLSLTRNTDDGVVNVVVRSSFNLLGDNSSIFTTGIDNWVGSLNCEASWDSVNQKLKLTGGGMSYAALDTAHTTFAATDTAYTTFEVMRTTQAAPTGTARALSGDQAGERIAVSPSIAYSAISTVRNGAATARTGKLGIRWYTAGGAPATTALHQGGATTLNPGVDTTVKVENVTSPADAAFAVVEFEWTTAAIGDIMLIDDVALASTSTISWSPSGNSFDITFVLEHSADGVTWTPVWACAKEAPRASDSGAVSQITVDDRSCPLGTQTIYYRAYAVSKFSTSAIWSSVATANCAGMAPGKWWLRRPEKATKASDIRVITPDFSRSLQLNREVSSAEGATAPVVSFGSAPDTESLQMTFSSLDKTTHDAIMAALKSTETLYLHTNYENTGYYFRAVDSVGLNARRATPISSYNAMRHMFQISVAGIVVKDPY